MCETISFKKFSEVDIKDTFFDSLRADYDGFDSWFQKKADKGEYAYVQYRDGGLKAFLYLKEENEELKDVEPNRPACKRLKVGTFKIDAHNTKLGERFVKKITDTAIYNNFEEVYVTIYAKHEGLIRILKKYGFEEVGKKKDELVLVKDMKHLCGDIIKDFPMVNTEGKKKYVLSIYPKYHTRLFPDSILRNEVVEKEELIKDVSYTNSIHKIYLCFMPQTAQLKRGDLVAIYRTSDGQGPARYRSVITSICQIEEVKTKQDFANLDDFIKYTNYYSIFDTAELTQWYRKTDLIVLKMTYNIALQKRVTRGYLLDEVNIPSDIYWGFFELTDDQFNSILKKGEVNENIIVHQA